VPLLPPFVGDGVTVEFDYYGVAVTALDDTASHRTLGSDHPVEDFDFAVFVVPLDYGVFAVRTDQR
jgi:hypothetical protein